MPMYRKKPVKVEARLYDPVADPEHGTDIMYWCNGQESGAGISIPTYEGHVVASPGDYVIRGVAGEFYPVKPDIFHATYEPV